MEKPFPEPTHPLDIVVVTLIVVGGVVMVIGNIVIFCNRGYRPIKTKSVPLTLFSSVGGLIWIVAALVVNDHFARKFRSGLDICLLWTYWLQACFGFTLWLNCLTLRLISLYHIFICKRNSRRFNYYILIPLLVPSIVFCIAASAAKHKQIKFRRKDSKSLQGDCEFTEGTFWALGLIALFVFYVLMFLGFAFRVRNAVSPLNEFRLIRRGGVLSLFLFLLSLVTLGTDAYYKPVGRCLLSAAVASAIFYYFWARNGVVVYNVLFDKKDYEDKFNAELRMSLGQNQSLDAVSRMENQLRVIRMEVEQYEDTKKQLEDEVKELELSYGAIQQKSFSHSSPGYHESLPMATREPC